MRPTTPDEVEALFVQLIESDEVEIEAVKEAMLSFFEVFYFAEFLRNAQQIDSFDLTQQREIFVSHFDRDWSVMPGIRPSDVGKRRPDLRWMLRQMHEFKWNKGVKVPPSTMSRIMVLAAQLKPVGSRKQTVQFVVETNVEPTPPKGKLTVVR